MKEKTKMKKLITILAYMTFGVACASVGGDNLLPDGGMLPDAGAQAGFTAVACDQFTVEQFTRDTLYYGDQGGGAEVTDVVTTTMITHRYAQIDADPWDIDVIGTIATSQFNCQPYLDDPDQDCVINEPKDSTHEVYMFHPVGNGAGSSRVGCGVEMHTRRVERFQSNNALVSDDETTYEYGVTTNIQYR